MAHDKYTATEPPYEPKHLAEYLSREIRRIEACIQALSEREDVLIVEGTATAVATTQENIIVESTVSTVIVTLPDVSECKGQQYFIKRIYTGTASVIVRASGTDTIEGVGSATLSAQWQGVTVFSDGTRWVRK